MTARALRAPSPWLLAGALLLASCGKQGDAPRGTSGPGASAPPGAPAAEAVLRPDTAPWPSTPASDAWELAAWMPQGKRVAGRRVDPEFLRAHGARMHTQSLWFDTVDAWRRWVRELKLPDDGIKDVMIVTEPIHFCAYLPNKPVADIVARLLAQGFTEQPLAGARAFLAPDAEAPIAALIDGRLVLGTGEATILERVIAVRAGREPSARSVVGLEAAVSAVGPGLPVEIDASEAGLREGPPGSPPMIASVGRLEAHAEPSEIRAFVMSSEADATTMRGTLETLLASVGVSGADRPLAAQHGPVLRLTSPASLGRFGRSFEGGIENDLGALTRALERYRSERAAWPSAAEGLAALQGVPGCLDEFLGAVPHDPWGRPYAYQPAHPKHPDGFLLRSLGPDGEIDTEDDVLPPE